MSLSLSNSLSFALIPLVKIGENSKNSIFFILEVQFHHEGGLSESRYFELFFSAWSIFLSCKKSAFTEPPFKLFWTLALILAKLVFKKCGEYFLVQNLGHNHLKKCKISCLVGFIEWKTSVYFCPLLVLFKPHWPS